MPSFGYASGEGWGGAANHLLVLPAEQQRAGRLLLPKQLHANLQREMSIRLLISEEGAPLIHPKVVEVILSQSFLTFCPPTRNVAEFSAPSSERFIDLPR